MEELPNIQPTMKCVWNKNKIIPTPSTHVITITLNTSIDIESIKQWLSESLSETLQNISNQTNAEEKLTSIETIKL